MELFENSTEGMSPNVFHQIGLYMKLNSYAHEQQINTNLAIHCCLIIVRFLQSTLTIVVGMSLDTGAFNV